MGQLPGGWLLVLSSHFEDAFKRLAVLASHGPAVACAVEEHVMYSEARGYKDGIEVWRVVSDCERDDDQIMVTGDPPARFNAIYLAAKQEQAADGDGDGDGDEDDSADYLFDVPPQVAEAVCGFRLGEPDLEGLRFIDLRKVSGFAPAGGGGRPRFFARLFGRR